MNNKDDQFKSVFENLSKVDQQRMLLYLRWLCFTEQVRRVWFHFLFPWLPDDLLQQICAAAPRPLSLNRIAKTLINLVPYAEEE